MRLIGNKVTEKDVRDELIARDYLRASIRLDELELAAIERPGWIQVFRFHGFARKLDGPLEELWGVVRDDERRKTEIWIVDSLEKRQKLLKDHSHERITLDRQPLHWLQRSLLLTFLVIVLLVLISWALS